MKLIEALSWNEVVVVATGRDYQRELAGDGHGTLIVVEHGLKPKRGQKRSVIYSGKSEDAAVKALLQGKEAK